MKLSALVLTKNEKDLIGNCLKQLKFADEIILLDQESSDKTVKIAQKYTDKIFKTKTRSFAKNRNFLAQKANGQWLLYVDADERLSQVLIAQIKQATAQENFSAYYIPRKNLVLGKWLKHGGWWPDYVPRLIRKDKLIDWYGEVHESPKIRGRASKLKTPIVHFTARNLGLMFSKSISWAKIEAELYFRHRPTKVTIFKVIKSMTREFFSRYFLKLGFLDGKIGLIASIYQSLHQAMVMTYLWEKQNSAHKLDDFKN